MRQRRAWLVVVAAVLALGGSPLAQTAPPAAVDYGAAVQAYVTGHDVAKAFALLGGQAPEKMGPAIENYLATRQSSPTAAAAFHLEIAIGVVMVSTDLAESHLALGQQFLRQLRTPRPGGPLMTQPEFADFAQRWFTAAASTFMMVNDSARALPLINRGLQVAPGLPELRLMAGIVDELSARLQGWMRARAKYEKLVADEPRFTRARIRLGRVLWLLDERNAALVELLRAQSEAREPDDRYLAAMFLGALYEQQKNVTGARVAYEAALAAAPRSQAAAVALGYLDVLAGRPDRAQALARTLLSRPPVGDAWWNYKNGGFETAALAWVRQRVWQ